MEQQGGMSVLTPGIIGALVRKQNSFLYSKFNCWELIFVALLEITYSCGVYFLL